MELSLKPESVNAEIAQNVAVIIATRRGTQPLDRRFGIDGEWLDDDSPRGRALLSATIIDALPQQERRIVVKQVTFGAGPEAGQVQPTIAYEIRGTSNG